MSAKYRFIFLILTAVLFFQCQKELSYVGGGDPGQVVLPSPLTANVQGNIVDESGQPAANVVVKIGAKSTTSDSKGYFRLNQAPCDQHATLVIAEKNGYFTAYRSFGATSGTNQVFIKLIRKSLGGTVSATTGGTISLNNGTGISLPASGVVKAADNSSYTGTINVYAAYIDPTSADILDQVPGSFMANDTNGKRVLLSSYGMIAVELESSAGEKLQIKVGNTATLTTPIPAAALASAPATIPLWFLEEATGLWKEEGLATKQGNYYVGTVKHFTYWNCDVPVPTITLSATFKMSNGQPLANASIVIKPTSGTYYGSAHGYTDSLGQISGPVPANMGLSLEVLDGCGNPVYTQQIGPFSEGVQLGSISVPAATPGIVTVKGKLTNCSGGAVTSGFAIISINNSVRYAKVDGSGNFNTNYVLCNTTGLNAQVLGVDESAQQQGNVTLVPVTVPSTDVGTITACGTVSTESIDYTLDGVSYHIGTGDSLVSYSVDSLGSANDFTYIMGARSPNFISFTANTTASSAGTYPLTRLSVQNNVQATIIQPLNLNLTTYAGSAGQFYQGSFTGQFKDGASVTHTLSCTFKVRRTN